MSHEKCKKFQHFLLLEFGRLFRMFSDLGKKETSLSEKLVELEFEVQRLRHELSEYHFYEPDV